MERLKRLIRDQAHRALGHPIDNYQFPWVLFAKETRQGTNTNYMQATIRLNASGLVGLGSQEFLQLEETLENVIRNHNHSNISEGLSQFVTPGAPQNILKHEADHLRPLPAEIKQEGIIDIVFTRTEEGDLELQGVCWYDYDRVTPREKALSCSEPRSLTTIDIQKALHQAGKTNDPVFVQQIQKRIAERGRHE